MADSLRLDGGRALPSIIRRRAAGAALSALAAVVLAAPLKLRTVGEGSQSGIRAPAKRVFRSVAEWERFRAGGRNLRPAPIDWKRETLLAVFLGERRSSGYRIRITRAESASGRLRVTVEQRAPRPGDITASVMTTPYHLVAVPRFSGDVTWVSGSSR